MKKIFIIATVLATALWSCDKFDVSNDNPDVALNISQNPELLLTNLQRRSIREAVGGSWSEGNLMGQYGARIVFTSFDLFDWGDQSGAWNNYYYTIRDAKELEKQANANGLNSYIAVSKIMQTWAYSILTDMWGDVPYSEVNQASEENYTPMYDTQEAIYTSMLAELAEANTILGGSDLTQIKGDLLFDGDLAMWRKFANSLRLRLALRLSEVAPSTASSVISAIYGSPAQNPVMDSNDDNATLTFLAANPDAHPVTEESVYRVGSYNEYRISEHFVNLLDGLNDPRLEFFADPTANSVEQGTPEIVGMLNGVVDGPAYTYQGGDAFLSKFNIDYFYYQSNTNQARLMLFSEVQFILAEAAQRGWITGDAQSFYEEGITANFGYWGVDMPADYLTSAGVAFDNSLETIMTQKYINLFYTDYQGFIEYKRTGFPATIAPGPDAFYDVYPSRFEYPSNEESLNNTNYTEAATRIGGDQITTKVWWEN
ncbi:SusD/RagB family nutrient-binding outer membrane lipoprotein [Flagellimonas zhangzhouensis]|uniref:Starch-binding associating with outer membrane n=1 Tax=Flagellimonas zhangzhouensis TaxID=1073328 RepID=A0A1H2U8B8_9FLAO|nr:SusD/RagB family nutrient-binding outer membrane lipoprotein [Allomuricauda zhangzhouensis]SDQ19215.1 Starch-binding associating with outer membrane [Allomuricauda zhangzhouensis]SDW52435.1 Starch-binding associating with outer membrane [Allomuricauda zhangzhouensis]